MNQAIEPIQPVSISATQTAVQAERPVSQPPLVVQESPLPRVDVVKRCWFDREVLFPSLAATVLVVALVWASDRYLTRMSQLPGAKSDTALIQTKANATVCEAFKVKHGELPKNLGVLLQKDKFGMIWMDDPARLIDPWGRPYRYNPNGPKNNGQHPDIWTVAPNGVVIGNWPKAIRH